jgi:hypothetical protein
MIGSHGTTRGVERVDALQQLVLDRMAELDLSFRVAAERSRIGHGKNSRLLVSPATLNNIALGKRTFRAKDETLDGIAMALDVAPSVVREAADRPVDKPVKFDLGPKGDRLNARQRRAVIAMVNAMLGDDD